MQINLGSAVYQPFTYEQLSAPFKDYKEAYKEAEAQYDLLLQQAQESLLLNEKTNPNAYKQYNDYLNQLDLAAKDLSRGRVNRNLLRGMKSGYYSKIQPIKKAEEKVQAANKWKQDLFAAGKDLEYKQTKFTIDDALNGDEFDPTAMDLNSVEKQGENLATNLAGLYKKGTEFVGGTGNYNKMGDQYLVFREHSGYTREELDNASDLFDDYFFGDKSIYSRADENSNEYKMAQSMIAAFENIDLEGYSPESKKRIASKFLEGMNKGLDNPRETLSGNGEYKTAHQRTSEAQAAASLQFQKDQAKKNENRFYMSTDDEGVTHYYHGSLEIPKSSVPKDVYVEEVTWSEWNLINLNQGKAPGNPKAPKEKEVIFKMDSSIFSDFKLKKTNIANLEGVVADAETKKKVIEYIRANNLEIPADSIKDVFVDTQDNVLIRYTEGSTGTTTTSGQASQKPGGGQTSDTTTNRVASSISVVKEHEKK